MPKADANIRVGADATAFSQTMDGLEKGIVKKMEKIGQVFIGAVGIGAGLRSLADSFSAFTAPAAKLEDAATVLEVMIGSADGAERLARSLQNLATNGVVSFDDLFRAARSLTNVFKDDATISHYVGMIANISAASKIPAERLADMIARMNDMGKVEFTELSNAGIPIIETLAEVLGVSREEIIKLNNEGKIGGSQLVKAFEKMTAAGARYHQQNTKQSNTTKGSWDTLKASIEECRAIIGKPINDTLRPILQNLGGWVQKNRGEIEKFGASLAPAVQQFSSVLTVAAPGLLNLGKAAAYITGAVAELAVYLSKGAAVAVYLGGSSHGLALVLGVLAQKMRGPVMAACFKMQASMRLMRMTTKKYGMQVDATAKGVKASMIGMVAMAKAAAIQMKAALLRSGWGIAVALLTEGVAWLYTKFADVSDEAQEIGAAAKEAAAATEAAVEASERELKLKEEEHRKEQERTRQMEEQARLAQEAADAEAERLKTVAEMARARRDNDFEREMDALREVGEPLGGGESGVVRERLRRVGAPSEEALYAERDKLERQRHMTEEQLRRYEQVAAAIAKIEEEHRRATDAAAEQRKEAERLRDNYYDRKSTYNRNRAEEAYEKKSIPAQEKQLRRDAQAAGYWGEMNPEAIRARLDELARQDAKANEDSIAALERILELQGELADRKAKYQAQRATDMQELRIQALELAGRKRAADALRDELELQQRITELRERGATKKQATEQATMEAKMREAAEQRARIQAARVEFIQGFQANVGGGGASFRLGNSQLQESKKHGRLLKEIRDYLRGQRNATSGVAVLA